MLVEGGGATLGGFFECDAVDEVHVFIGPKLIGGTRSKAAVVNPDCDVLAQCGRWTTETVENIDGDAYLRYVKPTS